MMQLITSDCYGEFADELAAMHRLRHRVFKERLEWDIQTSGDMEVDEFDALHPAYLLLRGEDRQVRGCVRFVPTTGPTMLRDVFPTLLGGLPAPSNPAIWESSRFALDLDGGPSSTSRGLAGATFELFAAMIEFGLAHGLTDIVTVTDARLERILRRAAWPLRRISEPQPLGKTLTVAGYLEVSVDCLARVRAAGGLKGPVLWAPVVQRTAA